MGSSFELAARIVFVSAPLGEVARRIARDLVERRLAACVNVLSGALSVYRWEGSIEEEEESLLVIKTSADRLPAIELFLADEHPYDTPECVALKPEQVEPRYLTWLLGEVGRPLSGEDPGPPTP